MPKIPAKAPTARSVTLYSGNHPKPGTPLLAVHPGPNRWHLYLNRPLDPDAPTRWYNLKLVAGKSAPRKANFWISFTTTQDRFGPLRDVALLGQYVPGMQEWVRLVIAEIDANGLDQHLDQDRAAAEALGDDIARALKVTGEVSLSGLTASPGWRNKNPITLDGPEKRGNYNRKGRSYAKKTKPKAPDLEDLLK